MAYIMQHLVDLSDPDHTGEFTEVAITVQQIAQYLGLPHHVTRLALERLDHAGLLSRRRTQYSFVYLPTVNLKDNA
jgi:DNA-binding GntR family transcriptional regulator